VATFVRSLLSTICLHIFPNNLIPSLKQARKVYDTALALQFQLPPSTRTVAPLLFRHYAEMEFYLPCEALERTAFTKDRYHHSVQVASNVALHIATAAVEESFASPHPPPRKTKKKTTNSSQKDAVQSEDSPVVALAPTRILKARNVRLPCFLC